MSAITRQDPLSTEVQSPLMAGFSEGLNKLSEILDLEVQEISDIPLTAVDISEDDKYRIYQADFGKKLWLKSPPVVIKKNGIVIKDNFTIDYIGGSISFHEDFRLSESDIVTADATVIIAKSRTIDGINTKIDLLENDTAHNKGYFDSVNDLEINVPIGQKGDYAFIGGEIDSIYMWDIESNTWKPISSEQDLSDYYTKAEVDNLSGNLQNNIDNVEKSIDTLTTEVERLESDKAEKEHEHSADDITSGKLPIIRGGTGAATAEEARSNLDITPATIGAAPASHTHNYAGSSSAGGTATSAVKLQTARTVRTNLANTGSASFDGTANITPGVTGTLPIANGGTGATSAATALNNLGGFPQTGGTIDGNVIINGTVAEGSRTTAIGDNSHAEGVDSTAIGKKSHAEGTSSTSVGNNSHAEGGGSIAIGVGSHTEGSKTIAGASTNEILKTLSYNTTTKKLVFDTSYEGYSTAFAKLKVGMKLHIFSNYYINVSHLFTIISIEAANNAVIVSGDDTNFTAGSYAVIIDMDIINDFNSAHAEGNETRALNSCTHAEGNSSIAIGSNSHAEGGWTTAIGGDSHAEGRWTTAGGLDSHAEGGASVAVRCGSHAEGLQTVAGAFIGEILKTLSYNTTTKKLVFDTSYEGYSTAFAKLKVGMKLHVFNNKYTNTAKLFTIKAIESANNAIIVSGDDTNFATGHYAVIIDNTVSGNNGTCHAEGRNTKAINTYAHAEGYDTTAKGSSSHAGGVGTIASAEAQTAIGKYNKESTNANDKFIIGIGTSSSARSNCFRVTNSAGVFSNASYNATGADFGEYFKWFDDNINHEDRVGLFVTLVGEEIRIANSNDDYILGIISAFPSIIGNSYEDEWHNRYQKDIFGRLIYEEVEVPANVIEIFDPENPENTMLEMISEAHKEIRPKVNDKYDDTKEYIPRSQRPEWAVVGEIGKLVVIDDGSCVVDEWCTSADGGIATRSKTKTRFRVMSRLDKNHVKVMIL